jgi:hypothetical protein
MESNSTEIGIGSHSVWPKSIADFIASLAKEFTEQCHLGQTTVKSLIIDFKENLINHPTESCRQSKSRPPSWFGRYDGSFGVGAKSWPFP